MEERAFGTGLRAQLARRFARATANGRGRAYARYLAALDNRLGRMNDALERLSRELAVAEERVNGRTVASSPPAVVPLAPVAEPEPAGEVGPSDYLLFVPSPSGYSLVGRSGALPTIGSELELSEPDRRFLVCKLARAPFPGDPRRCAYLQFV